MKNKITFNWATGIFLTYSVFVAIIIILVMGAFKQNIDLVAPNYYEQELKFQNRQAELQRSNSLTEKLSFQVGTQEIAIQFPTNATSNISGKIVFFRPSDKSLDVSFPILVNEQAQMSINKAILQKGMYKMQISWAMNDETYFNEDIIVIQ